MNVNVCYIVAKSTEPSVAVLQAQLNICVAYGSSKDIAVYQAIGLQPEQIYIIGKVAKKHRKEAVVRYLSASFLHLS